MKNYNKMSDRMNQLIQTAYVDKLKQQEMDIARQNAELLALHSQINPHFLFNALESIRMHSLLKNEKETSEMVEHLAVMQRVNVDWHSDSVSVEEELKFIQAYLELQKYRFGERLNYNLDVSPDCYKAMLPKLSIVTFVENACVHGIESKTEPGWIFVRIYKTDTEMVFEIEDTGIGMDEEVLNRIGENFYTTKPRGTGLGVSLSKEIIKLHGGVMKYESVLDKGTTVFIDLPKNVNKKSSFEL
jgi:two-component system sensor histidine kinase YesM